MIVKVYYRRYANDERMLFAADPKLTLADIASEQFALVTDLRAGCLEDVFRHMQGEVWSPNGEARDLIRSLGLCHTSMSVGDVVVDENGIGWQVDCCGFARVGA